MLVFVDDYGMFLPSDDSTEDAIQVGLRERGDDLDTEKSSVSVALPVYQLIS